MILAAVLTYDLMFGVLAISYPSDGRALETCVGETCFAPSGQPIEFKAWTAPVPYVRVQLQWPDGTLSYVYAWPLEDVET